MVLYSTILNRVHYNTILYLVQYSTILCRVEYLYQALYSTILFKVHYHTILYRTVQYNTILIMCSTVQQSSTRQRCSTLPPAIRCLPPLQTVTQRICHYHSTIGTKYLYLCFVSLPINRIFPVLFGLEHFLFHSGSKSNYCRYSSFDDFCAIFIKTFGPFPEL